MTGVARCTHLPRWLGAVMLGIGALFMLSGAERWNADLSLTPTVSLIEVAYCVMILPAVAFMLGNYLDAERDHALVRARGTERRRGLLVISCGNVRGDLYLLVASVVFLAFGIGSLLAPPPPDARRSLLSGLYTALFLDLTLWTLWLSIQNRRERKLLLGQPFWPQGQRHEVARAWHILRRVLRGGQ